MKKVTKVLLGAVCIFMVSVGMFAANTNSKEMLKAGFLNNTYGPWKHKEVKISEAAQKGYNTLVLAFAELKGDTPMEFCGDQFLAYTTWETFTAKPSAVDDMVNDIKLAKQKYGLKHVLVSVGGATDTFQMGNPKVMADNVVDFLDKFNLDGIDFDLEHSVDPSELDQLIKDIKTARPGTIVSAAPQFNEISTGDYNFVTSGKSCDYTTAINNGEFDYLFVQLYNTDSYSIDGYNQKDAEFVSAAFNYMIDNNLVPKTTMIVPGEPASEAGGGEGTIYHNVKYSTQRDAWNAVRGQVVALSNQAQFGGFFTWSVNHDADSDYGFSNTVFTSLKQ